MPLSARQIYQGAIHHTLKNARKGQEREYALFFVRTMAADLQGRKMYSSALVARQLLAEMSAAPKLLGLAAKYGTCPCCTKLPKDVRDRGSAAKPPASNTGATPRQLKILEDYV